jgi:hypothetical protein
MLSNGKERKRKVYANARDEIRMAIDFWREMILMGLLNISRKKPLFVREAFHAKSWREWSKKSSSPVLSQSKGRPQPLGRAERTSST